jgi:hypothetical protein
MSSFPNLEMKQPPRRDGARARVGRASQGLSFGFNPRKFTVSAVGKQTEKVTRITKRPTKANYAPWNRKEKMSRRKAINPYPVREAKL